MTATRTSVLILALLCGVFGAPTDALSWQQFVPNSQTFWDFSKNWTTEYGPAYRDTIEKRENLVPCTGPYALCFQSGPEPLPCVLARDGRSANCTCTVAEGLNYVLISAILNYEVYLATVAKCGVDGSKCAETNSAPVCEAISKGKLIPRANLISTFSPDAQSAISAILADPSQHFTNCPTGPSKVPYAACMTAPCRTTRSGDAQCSCPVFWGRFLLTQPHATCDLEDNLVWSASFTPLLLKGDQ